MVFIGSGTINISLPIGAKPGKDFPHIERLGRKDIKLRPQDIIRKKRDRAELSPEEIESFVRGVTSGAIADYQSTALLMAIFLNGMTDAEQSALTTAMLHSGDILDFSDIPKPKADKHSTGGVGDKTSLLIAPLAAAAGICVIDFRLSSQFVVERISRGA